MVMKFISTERLGKLASLIMLPKVLPQMSSITFAAEVNYGNLGTGSQIDFTLLQKVRAILNSNTTMSFLFPPGVGNYQVILVQDATGGRTVIWPADAKYVGSLQPPAVNTTANSETLVSIYYNGTNTYISTSFVNA